MATQYAHGCGDGKGREGGEHGREKSDLPNSDVSDVILGTTVPAPI